VSTRSIIYEASSKHIDEHQTSCM